jgi:hypothetical protein
MPWSEASRRCHAKRLREHRCSQCGAALEPASAFKCCSPCREHYRDIQRSKRKPSAPRRSTAHRSTKWADVDNPPRCNVCGLTLPHTCLGGSALDRRAVDLG